MTDTNRTRRSSTALVTGAATGIDRELAKTLARNGHKATMAGKGRVVPGLYNKVQVLSGKLMPRSATAKTAKMMLR